MRIISGLLKGRSLNFIKSSITRPLKDSVRENIFNIIEHFYAVDIKIKDSIVLDLYSGTGSFGLECISREAKKVIFVEQDKDALHILNKNLIQFSVLKKSIIINNNIENYLKSCKNKFNIFFFDPPFKDKEFIKYLITIKKKKIYKKNHIIIIHREKKANDNLENYIHALKIKQYGRSKIIIGIFN
mgnify:CR=1 FL=1|tara:strand:- start:558 stop:1115 length:558 start_codon:yes stop_codon:yes gene_type:complete